jgi:DNA replication protein DnaC
VCVCLTPWGDRTGYVHATHYSDGTLIPPTAPEGLRALPCVCSEEQTRAALPVLYRRWCNLPAHLGTFTGYDTRDADPRAAAHKQAALEAVKQWAQGKGAPLLFLLGTPGTGKTHLATAAISALLGAPVYARYEHVPSLIDDLREHQLDYEYVERHAQLQAVEALALDDLGGASSSLTEWALGECYKVVDGRYRNDKPLLVTTNCAAEVLEAVEPRLWSRLMDRGRGRQVVMAWADARQEVRHGSL